MPRPESTYLIYTTFPNLEEAKNVSCQVVQEKLAACSNILPGMLSIYEWDGNMEEGQEVVVLFKTSKEQVDKAVTKINSLHSYDVPAVLVLPVVGGGADFLSWIAEQTGKVKRD